MPIWMSEKLQKLPLSGFQEWAGDLDDHDGDDHDGADHDDADHHGADHNGDLQHDFLFNV